MVTIRRALKGVALGVAGLAAAAALGSASSAAPTTRTVDLVQVKGILDPAAAQYVRDRLAGAAREDAEAVILQLDTPGGLQVSNDELTSAVLDSDVPVVAWVAPRGARAASTGALLVYASNLAFVADQTELGPAGPPTLGRTATGQRVAEAELFQKLSQMRGRGPGSPPPPIVGASPVDAGAAVAGGYVDGAATSLGDLLRAIDGAQVQMNGRSVTLETWDEGVGAPDVTISFAQMNLLQRLRHATTSPEVALILFLLGLFGLIFELYNPGIGLAAILGVVALVLSVYALSVLPTNWGGVLVVTAGVVLLLVDVQSTGLGLPSAAGLIAVALGAVVMFHGAAAAVALSPWAVVGAVVLTLVFFVSVITAALRVRLRRPIDDESGVVGAVGEAKTDIAPEGTVLTNGTLWRARTMETGIAAGSRVEVKATEGLVLLVEPLHEAPASGGAEQRDAPVE